MTPLEWKEIEHELENTPTPTPPEDLLARIQEEIPSADELANEPPAPRRPSRRQRWLMAASVMIALSAGWLAYQVREGSSAREPIAAGTESVEENPRGVENDELSPEVRRQLEALAYMGSGSTTPATSAPDAAPDGASVRNEAEQVPARANRDRAAAAARAELDANVATDELIGLSGKVAEGIDAAERRADIAREEAILREELMNLPGSGAPVPPGRLPAGVQEEAPAFQAAPVREAISSMNAYVRESGLLPSEARLPAPSTGGTAEPNDAPYGDVFFEHPGTNPFVDTEDDPLSTFGLDVDTGSYTVARRYLQYGHLPPAEAIRVEEFVNYFDYGDAPPRRGDFALTAEAAPSLFGGGPRHLLVRFNVSGRVVSDANRKPATLIFVVDVSGSMERENRLGLVKQSLGLLLDELRPDDRVGLVVYGHRAEVLLEPTADLKRIRAAVDRLQPSGSTNAEDGILTGYRLIASERDGVLRRTEEGDDKDGEESGRRSRRLASMPREDRIYRVILCSDGVANVGRTGPDSILERIEREAASGIELTTIGFGMGNYNDVLMEQLADRGDGSYAYVDTLHEARRIFVENLTGTLQTIASDAKIQVEFDPETVSRYRLLGYENRAIRDEDFRNDAVDAGEIGAGHSVTALYEIKLHADAPARGEIAQLNLRYRSKATERVEENSTRLRLGDASGSWEAASPSLRLASVVGEFAEQLKKTYWAQEGSLDAVLPHAQRVSADFAGDADVAELVDLIGKAARVTPPNAQQR